jgi:hypothetical protein
VNPLNTVWRITGLEGWGRLDVLLVVETTAPQVVAAIEAAAAANGIELEQVEPEAPGLWDNEPPQDRLEVHE